MPRERPQLICFSYHKSGTSLLWHVMNRVCARLGLKLANRYGEVQRIDPDADVVLLPHSRLRGPVGHSYRAIRMVRDPRDIWVSGYLYHLRCTEEWCVNTDFDTTRPIEFPQVDHVIAHWPHEAKADYLRHLNGRSYQQNLQERSRNDGLAFELAGYTGWTLASMRDWPENRVDALDIRLESIMADFDGGMRRIFSHFGFTDSQVAAALDVARHEDVRRMDDATLFQRPQVSSRTASKWRAFLTPEQVAGFEERHGDLICDLGYALHDAATSVPGFQILADGIRLRAVSAEPESFTFIVPRGHRYVRLLASTIDPRPGNPLFRPGALPVREIVVEAGGDMVTIPADDPRLAEVGPDPDQDGWALGSGTAATLPWIWSEASAKVTVRCPLPHTVHS